MRYAVHFLLGKPGSKFNKTACNCYAVNIRAWTRNASEVTCKRCFASSTVKKLLEKVG